MNKTSMSFVVAVVFGSVVVTGCVGGDGVVGTLPASVSGVWSMEQTNADGAFLANCTGDLASFEGDAVAEVAPTSGCALATLPTVSQNGGTFTIEPRSYACPSTQLGMTGAQPPPQDEPGTVGRSNALPEGIDMGTTLGGGTVDGTEVTGQIDTNSSISGVQLSEYFEGSVDGLSLSLSEERISVDGAMTGSCDIVPALETTVTIQ